MGASNGLHVAAEWSTENQSGFDDTCNTHEMPHRFTIQSNQWEEGPPGVRWSCLDMSSPPKGTNVTCACSFSFWAICRVMELSIHPRPQLRRPQQIAARPQLSRPALLPSSGATAT